MVSCSMRENKTIQMGFCVQVWTQKTTSSSMVGLEGQILLHPLQLLHFLQKKRMNSSDIIEFQKYLPTFGRCVNVSLGFAPTAAFDGCLVYIHDGVGDSVCNVVYFVRAHTSHTDSSRSQHGVDYIADAITD